MTRGMNYSACLYIRSHFPVSFVALFAARFSGPEVEDEWTPGLARCVCVFACLCERVCVSASLSIWERERDTSNWIEEHKGHMLQGPVTIMTSNPRISMIHTNTHAHMHTFTHAHMHARRVCHTSSVSCSQETFCWCRGSSRCSSCCCLCCCCWARSVSGKELSNLHKMSVIDHCILPSHSVNLTPLDENQNTLLSKLSNMENGVGK